VNSIDAVAFSRVQFALVEGFHFLSPRLTIGRLRFLREERA